MRTAPNGLGRVLGLGAVLVLSLELGVGRIALAEETPRYETVVRGQSVEERPPADDPAGFSSVLVIKNLPAGAELGDLLERVPGLRIRDSGPSGRKTLSLRGADGQQVLVLLDGIRLSGPGGPAFDLSLLDPGLLSEVEVRRGGGGARYGAGALGGVLALRTPPLRTRSRTSVSVGLGSFDTVAARASHSGSAGRLRYLASGGYRQAEGTYVYLDHNGGRQVRLNNDEHGGEALAKIDFLYSDRLQIGLLEDFAVQNRGAPGTSYAPSATARQDDLRNLVALRLTRRDAILPGGRVDLVLNQRTQHFRFEETTQAPVLSDSLSLGLGASATASVPLGRVGRADGGVDLRGEFFRDPDTENPSRLEVDLFLSGEVRIAGRYLSLVPAARLATATGFDAAVAPRVGIVSRPLAFSKSALLASIEIAGNAGRSFRYPSFQEMYIRLDGYGQNPFLHPEDSIDFDGGLRFWREGPVAVEVAYFQRRIKNLILFTPVAAYLVRADNFSNALAQGVEASLVVRPGLGLSFRGAYTFTRAHFSDPPLPLPGQPDHRFVGRVDWQWPIRSRGDTPSSRFGLGLFTGVTIESGTSLDRANSILEEGRVLLSAGGQISYRLPAFEQASVQQFTLSLEGKNLLDKRDAVDTIGFPLAPAHLFAALSAAF